VCPHPEDVAVAEIVVGEQIVVLLGYLSLVE
jgi:hypothetical protein